MHRAITLFLLVAVCSSAVVPSNESEDEISQGLSTTSQISNQLQTYATGQSTRLTPSNQYHYPTYSEYGGSGFPVQSGYEGYLVPSGFAAQRNSHWITNIATSLIPLSSQLLVYGARVGVYALYLFLTVVVGGLFTTIACTFTPLCSINFLGIGLTKNQVKDQVAELARTYITPESVNAATVLVSKAIDKYTAMQRESEERSMQEEKGRQSKR